MAKTPITLRGTDVSMQWANATQAVQYTACKVTTTEGSVDLAAAVTDYPLGIVQNAPKQNEAANVRISGWSYMVAGANNLAAGDLLKVDTSGRGVLAAKAGAYVASSKYVVAIALSPSANIGDWITVEIRKDELDI
jgi:hypothetical protein